MKRDGEQKSLWQDSVSDYQPVNNWQKDEIYDVLIVGGGITGLTTALLLQSEGKRCILAEANNIGFGTTGGTTSHLNTITDTSYDILEKNFDTESTSLVATGMREAIDLMEGLINKYKIDCSFTYKTAYMFAETDNEAKQLDSILKATERAGVVCSETNTLPIPFRFTKAIRIEMQAQMHALKHIHGLAAAYEQEGGILLQNCTVSNHKREHCYHVETTLGVIKAYQIVYATHIPPGLTLFNFRCAPYRSYAAAVTLKDGNYPDALVYDIKSPYHYFRTQQVNGTNYLIAGGFDHKTGHNDNTEQVFRELEAYIRTHFKVDSIAYKWSSQYYEPTDRLPYIGLMPGDDDIYVATGYSGNGIIFGTLAGKILCEEITNHKSRYEKLFSPDRIKPVAGFTNFIKENADVVSKFIGMRFSYERVYELAALAPGESVLAEWEGHKVALHKDENGKLHALDPVCPHAGCLVAWNNAEKSWDCPCHGSRFAANGALLTGPAMHGLSQIKWEDIEGD